jgi:hypothetical protein
VALSDSLEVASDDFSLEAASVESGAVLCDPLWSPDWTFAPKSTGELVSAMVLTTVGVVDVLPDADATPEERPIPTTDPPRAINPATPTPIFFIFIILYSSLLLVLHPCWRHYDHPARTVLRNR